MRARYERRGEEMGMKIFAMALSFDCLSAEQIPDHRERYDQQHAHDREAPDAVHSSSAPTEL